ncbi:hypothetical protein [Flammeovirga pacifica]|uniref:Uncharacterized protein n=1 Tax=Flammeovirga pacifica TaxID=915059 RepID=A0A1S1YXJ9_FLAPC|nr:hypothetical protein [Flammeovirga pacifica]OHX65729.1 hypothetical protein NH26_04865 [Flammeovirga pacifica]
MEYVDLILQYQNKNYNAVIDSLSEKLDSFQEVSLKEFQLWAEAYLSIGKIESAQSILSIAVIEEGIIELEEDLIKLNNRLKQLKDGLKDLKTGIEESENIYIVKEQLKTLFDNYSFEEMLLLMEDILSCVGEKQIPQLWFGQMADQLFKANEQLILYSKYKSILLDAIIYYYINTSKVFTEDLNYIQKKRLRSFN